MDYFNIDPAAWNPVKMLRVRVFTKHIRKEYIMMNQFVRAAAGILCMTTMFAQVSLAQTELPPAAVGEMPTIIPVFNEQPSVCTPDVNQWGFPSTCVCSESLEYNPQTGLCVGTQEPAPVEIGSLTGSVPTNGACSNAQGTLKLSISRYEGGAAPFPGMIIANQVLVFNGVELGNLKTLNQDGQRGHWPIDVSLSPKTQVVLERTGNQRSGRSVYAVVVKVLDKASKAKIVETRVICENSWNFMLP